MLGGVVGLSVPKLLCISLDDFKFLSLKNNLMGKDIMLWEFVKEVKKDIKKSDRLYYNSCTKKILLYYNRGDLITNIFSTIFHQDF